jgi:hypothetical protein
MSRSERLEFITTSLEPCANAFRERHRPSFVKRFVAVSNDRDEGPPRTESNLGDHPSKEKP